MKQNEDINLKITKKTSEEMGKYKSSLRKAIELDSSSLRNWKEEVFTQGMFLS